MFQPKRLARLGAAALLACPLAAPALSPGDIAIVGFNFDDPDELAFVALVDIPPGTSINFTDNGWFAAGGFRANEGTFTWTAPATVAAGTVVNPAVSGVAFSSAGDQVLAYQGDASSPTFLHAVNSEGTGWQADATNANTSALPAGLVDGLTAVALAEVDNATYTGATSGTREELLALINNPANWTGNDAARLTMPAGPFTVGGASPDDPDLSVAGSLDFGTIEPSTTSTLPLSITNTGAASTLTIANTTTITGTDAARFSIVSPARPFDIAPGATTSLQVQFAPGASTGSFAATLRLDSNDESSASINVSLSGQSAEPLPLGSLVINEISYDDPGADNESFIEVLNVSGSPVDLAGVELVLFDGQSQSAYFTQSLTGTLAAGAYYWIAISGESSGIITSGSGPLPRPANLTISPGSLQNGPDGVHLRRASDGAIIDLVSYAGANAHPAGSPDSGNAGEDSSSRAARSLSRVPDGVDTGDNAADFQLAISTPGRANDYYRTANEASAAALRSSLNSIISNMDGQGFSSARGLLEVMQQDPANSSSVILFYTGRSQAKTGSSAQDLDYGTGGYNVEHIWPQSRFDSVEPINGDLHHLRLTDSDANNLRSNNVYNNIADADATGLPAGWTGSEFGNKRRTGIPINEWEPRDGVKGDAARALFYLDVRYEGSPRNLVLANDATVDDANRMGYLAPLLEWHYLDLPDDFEHSGNDYIYQTSRQGNRNPFIDNPGWVDCIYFGNCDDTTAPSAPAGLVANVVGANVVLTWNASTDAPASGAVAGYRVFRGASSGAQIPVPRNELLVTGTTFTDPGAAGGTWFYTVEAIDRSLNVSAPSNEAIVGVVDDYTISATSFSFGTRDALAGPFNANGAQLTALAGPVTINENAAAHAGDLGVITYTGPSTLPIAAGSSAFLPFQFAPPANDGSSYSATFAFTSPNVPSGFTITVTGAAQSAAGAGCTELFLSEYVEGGSNNKAVEIFNPTNAAVVLDGVYALEFYANGSATPTTTINLAGSVPSLGTFVVADNDSVQAVLDATQQQSTATFYNGNDAVVLARNGQPIDRVGRVGENAIWTGGGISTQNQTLRRKASISIGDPAVSDPFDPSVEWLGFPQDTFDGLGAHVADECPPASAVNDWTHQQY